MARNSARIIFLIAILGGGAAAGCGDDNGGAGEAGANGDSDADTDGDADTDSDGDGDSDTDTDMDSDTDTDADTDTDTDTDTDADTDTDTDTDADTEDDIEPDTSKMLEGSHPGWGDPRCRDCHAGAHFADSTISKCVPCHGANGALAGHTSCGMAYAGGSMCHANEHGGAAAGFPAGTCGPCHGN